MNAQETRAWRVEKVERDEKGPFKVIMTPLYYGPDEDGPKVGTVLVPEEPEAG